MSDARSAILARVDRAARTAQLPDVSHVEAAPRATMDAARDVDVARLQERFVTEARALGVDVFLEPTAARVRERLAELVAAQRVFSWNADQLPYGAGTVVAGATSGSAPRDEQAAAEVGVTACHGAIAETGTLALLSKPGCSRAASLLPPLHVAIVDPARLFGRMGDFFQACADEISAASNLTFVTGPSRTADIELTLTIGVHGPRRVAMIVGPLAT
jgi:L-lactate dehydrogenase complex protein LldG